MTQHNKQNHLVIVGFDEIVFNKYMSVIDQAVKSGNIQGYSIIELESQRSWVFSSLEQVKLQPQNTYFIKEPRDTKEWSAFDGFKVFFEDILSQGLTPKVYIATEVRAHESYLKYCVEMGFESLTEKPVFAPMRNGTFHPESIDKAMAELLQKSRHNSGKHSVMTLGRYHPIYNDIFINKLKEKMSLLSAPISSIHLKVAGGVWNKHSEYINREDHPYKYGYGMIMHGAYHYLDILCQCIELNGLFYELNDLVLSIKSFAAFPGDQSVRVSEKYSAKISDQSEGWVSEYSSINWGETDVTSIIKVLNMRNNKVLTLGTISLEQTTPSVRSWSSFPEGVYNKNGRVSDVLIEARLAHLFSIKAECYDLPSENDKNVDRLAAESRVTLKANAAIIKDEKFYVAQKYSGLFHSESNKKLMTKWLSGNEHKSSLGNHDLVMRLAQAICLSIKDTENEVKMSLLRKI